jgi:hypothetical protein
VKRLFVLSFILLVAVGCNTIRGTFGNVKPDYTVVPSEELRTVALQIEQAIAAEERSPEFPANPEVSLDSDSIRQAIRSRASRFPLLDEFRNSGFAIEKPDGLVWIQRSREYRQQSNSRDRDRDALLINGENGNRWVLYESLLKANNWPPRALGAVQRIFFEARLQVMSPGQPYETVDGATAVVGGS